MSRPVPTPTARAREKAITVGVDFGRSSAWPLADSMAELDRLVGTDGADVVCSLTQRLDSPVPRTFIGSGKTRELVDLVRRYEADVVVFDDELTPSQQSNLEKAVGEPVKIIDRTALILDIFGRHAKTSEGRLQVQLAQLKYLLPRLRGMWSHLMGEQTRGGIGSRFGQGESQLEVDRRLVRDRISTLRRELAGLESRRTTQSKARWDSGIYRVALAGYTNAGKSTLLNALTGSDVYSKDELFATLDPTTRALDLSEGRRITITDTVGFIQKLPTTLVEAFKSTLSEVRSADLILLVVDASEPNYERQVKAVNDVLDEIGAGDVTTLLVFNKCDLAGPDVLASLRSLHPEACLISAFEKRGLEGLMFQISTIASQGDVSITATIPYDKGMLIKLVHERGQVLRESYEQEGLVVTARVSPRLCSSLAPYLTGGGDLD